MPLPIAEDANASPATSPPIATDSGIDQPSHSLASHTASPAMVDSPKPRPSWIIPVYAVLAAIVIYSCALPFMPDGIWKKHWGDAASIFGLIVSIWTLIVARQAKRAAEDARSQVFRFDAAIELARACEIMHEIQELHRRQTWENLPKQYSIIRQKLIAVKAAESVINDQQSLRIAGVLSQLKRVDAKIEVCVGPGKKQDSPAKPLVLMGVVKEQTEHLTEILAELRNTRDSNV